MANLRFIKDFPKEGVNFIDITPKLADKEDFETIINKMCEVIPEDVDYIISPESRGFIFGCPIANKLKKGFVPVRKEGKLPDDLVIKEIYEKEYGKDILCLPKNENYENKKFYFVDDVLATGGTLKACKNLINKCKGQYSGAGVYINITELNNEDVNFIEEY